MSGKGNTASMKEDWMALELVFRVCLGTSEPPSHSPGHSRSAERKLCCSSFLVNLKECGKARSIPGAQGSTQQARKQTLLVLFTVTHLEITNAQSQETQGALKTKLQEIVTYCGER
jgi:hypothetical protein